MPYRERSVIGNLILLVRWPVLGGLLIATLLQTIAAFTPIAKLENINLPELIPPLNTAILCLLWWRISQLEKMAVYFRSKFNHINEEAAQDARDDRRDARREARRQGNKKGDRS